MHASVGGTPIAAHDFGAPRPNRLRLSSAPAYLTLPAATVYLRMNAPVPERSAERAARPCLLRRASPFAFPSAAADASLPFPAPTL